MMERQNIPAQALRTAELLERLWDSVLGIYLYGSSVCGGLHPDSDIDLLMICGQEMPDDIRHAITARLLEASGRVGETGRRPLEVTAVSRTTLDPWRFPPICEYQYGEWLRPEFEAGALFPARPDPDLTLLLWQARDSGIPLKGPDAAVWIPEIPMGEIRGAMRDSLPKLLDGLQGDERNVLLTLARMWFTAVQGEITSKDRAAAWLSPQLPDEPRRYLELARRAYLGECADCWRGLQQETADTAAYLEKRIRDLLAAGVV